MTYPLSEVEKSVFGADAKRDDAGNIIERGSGNLTDRKNAAPAVAATSAPVLATAISAPQPVAAQPAAKETILEKIEAEVAHLEQEIKDEIHNL